MIYVSGVVLKCYIYLCFSTPPSSRDRRLRDSGFFPKTLEASAELIVVLAMY